jgi:ribosomal-protein-alanine N-acetyltransferase
MTHKGTVTLETERLILRRFTPEDAYAMFHNWASDPNVTKYLMWQAHPDIGESRKIATLWSEEYVSEKNYQWAIVPKELNEPIGSIASVRQNELTSMVHIGYAIGKKWWGLGYTTEALKRLVRFFFEDVGVKRIEALHDPHNPASGRVMQKAGLHYEALLRQADWNNQGICDAVCYAILADEYFSGNKPQTAGIFAPPKYVRVQTSGIAYLTGKPRGIFASVSHLERDGKLTAEERETYHYIDKVWFQEQLPNPPFYDDDSPGKPITWFKTATAMHMLGKLQPLMDMLDKYGVPYDVAYTNFPGEIVYEDEWQVAVL